MTAAIEIPSAAEQLAVLTRGTADIHTVEDLTAALQRSHATQTPLIVKTGFDPTAADLHFGHTVLIEKMAQFQRLGHAVTFLIGDYTARIGDPTGRNKARPPLTDAEIQANARTYTEQCFKILDRERTKIEWNSRWLKELTFEDIVRLASKYNLGRMLERRDFKTRFETNVQIAMHELLYPLVQAYDSVVMKADVELGGHDQIFNLDVGRDVMRAYDLRPQAVLTVPLLVGLDGQQKMSKSTGNHVGIMEPARDMFGKTMSISDDTMWDWIPLLTGRAVEAGADPLASKKALARELVARFHGAEEADATLAWWDGGRQLDGDTEAEVVAGPLFKVVVAAGGASSGGDARRKIKQGGVYLEGERQTDEMFEVAPGSYMLRVGKKWAVTIRVRAAD